MFIPREQDGEYVRADYFNRRYYLQSRGVWTPSNTTGVLCYDDVVCQDECCHDMDFGMPYCCSKYMGFIYLGLMVGAGVIVAVLVIACYICMTKTERQLEAAAKLEAAKAANNHGNVGVAEASSATDQTDVESEVNSDLSLAPPAYNEVMRTFTRCHSCDVGRAPSSQRAAELVDLLMRQHSEGNQTPGCTLPPLVDVAALIARHRSEHGLFQGLPPLMSHDDLNSKLPTYEECTSQNTRSRSNASDEVSEFKASNQLLQTCSPCFQGDNAATQTCNVKMESQDSHFVSVSEAMQGLGGMYGVDDANVQLRNEHSHWTRCSDLNTAPCTPNGDNVQFSSEHRPSTRCSDVGTSTSHSDPETANSTSYSDPETAYSTSYSNSDTANCTPNGERSQGKDIDLQDDGLRNSGSDVMTTKECDLITQPSSRDHSTETRMAELNQSPHQLGESTCELGESTGELGESTGELGESTVVQEEITAYAECKAMSPKSRNTSSYRPHPDPTASIAEFSSVVDDEVTHEEDTLPCSN